MTETVEKQALLAIISDPLKERLMDKLREQLGDAYYCTRSWDAWRYKTMSEDDFECVAHDDNFIKELADSILLTLLNK